MLLQVTKREHMSLIELLNSLSGAFSHNLIFRLQRWDYHR